MFDFLNPQIAKGKNKNLYSFKDQDIQTDFVIALALQVAQEQGGYVSQANSSGSNPSTSSTLKYILALDYRILADEVENMDLSSYREETEELIEWVRSLDEEEIKNNQYLYNLKTILTGDYIRWKDIGIAASAMVARKNYLEKQERERKEKRSRR